MGTKMRKKMKKSASIVEGLGQEKRSEVGVGERREGEQLRNMICLER